MLEGLAEEGRTVIATIHQSRSDLFPHFGNILLLAEGGQVVYSGGGNNMIQHFASLGHTCPSTTNPADFAMDIISVDLREERNEVVSRGKVQNLIRQFAEAQQSRKLALQNGPRAEGLGLAGLEGRTYAPMRVAVPILLRQGSLCFKRRPDLASARIMQVVGLGLFIDLFFAPLKTDYLSLQNRLGVIQQTLSGELSLFHNVGYVGADLCVSVFCGDVAERWPIPIGTRCLLQGTADHSLLYLLLISQQEYADRAYSVNSFFFTYLILEVPFEIASSLLLSLLLVGVNLQRTVSMHLVIVLVSFCLASCGESVGIMFNTLILDTAGFALNITGPLLMISVVMAGEHPLCL